MKKWFKVITILVILGLFNYKYSINNKKEFMGEVLPSDLVSGRKEVESLEKVGYLTYGPYISLSKGEYKIKIYYDTDTNQNTFDIYSEKQQFTWEQGVIEADRNIIYADISLNEDISDLEVRTYYTGEGKFSLEKIVIQKKIGYLQIIENIIIILFLIILLKGNRTYKKKYSYIFAVILMIPLFLSGIFFMTGKKFDILLHGNFLNYNRPELSLEKFVEGEYQKELEQWWNEKFVPRGVLITSYNQLRYSFFSMGNRIIGKNGMLFEESYIEDVLCASDRNDYSLEENQKMLKEYVDVLNEVSEKLEKIDKTLIVYTTPNKAVAEYDAIPDKYIKRYKREDKIRAIDFWNQLANNMKFYYINSWEILKEEKSYPIFYKTGIHWSRPAEQTISKRLTELIKNDCKLPIKTMELLSLKSSDKAYWRDSDLYDLLNIWVGDKDSVYYEYEVETYPAKETELVNILIQGGSFALGFRKDFMENQLGGSIVDIFYQDYVIEEDETKVLIESWENLDLKKYLNDADVVIIEINEAVIQNYSNGFVFYFNDFLDRYMEKEENENIDFKDANSEKLDLIKGFYEVEEGYCWVQKESMATVNNTNIKERGLEIDFVIPEYLGTNGTIDITINQNFTKSIELKNRGEQSVIFSADELNSETDHYIVQIHVSDSFIPKMIGLNSDERDLSIMIQYIGERK